MLIPELPARSQFDSHVVCASVFFPRTLPLSVIFVDTVPLPPKDLNRIPQDHRRITAHTGKCKTEQESRVHKVPLLILAQLVPSVT